MISPPPAPTPRSGIGHFHMDGTAVTQTHSYSGSSSAFNGLPPLPPAGLGLSRTHSAPVVSMLSSHAAGLPIGSPPPVSSPPSGSSPLADSPSLASSFGSLSLLIGSPLGNAMSSRSSSRSSDNNSSTASPLSMTSHSPMFGAPSVAPRAPKLTPRRLGGGMFSPTSAQAVAVQTGFAPAPASAPSPTKRND